MVIADDHLEFYLRQEVHCIFAAAINFGVALLTAKTFDLTYCHALDSNFSEGIFYFFEFEWFYYRFNFFHLLFWGFLVSLDNTHASRIDTDRWEEALGASRWRLIAPRVPRTFLRVKKYLSCCPLKK